MRLYLIADGTDPIDRLNRRGRAAARKVLAGHVKDPDLVFDLMTSKLAQYDKPLPEVQEWWAAMMDQWLYLDQSTLQQIQQQVLQDSAALFRQGGTGQEVPVSEGLGGFFGFLKNLTLMIAKGLVFYMNSGVPQGGGGGGAAPDLSIKGVNSDIAANFVQKCLIQSQRLRPSP